jgi:hypothetical protein
MSDWPASLAVGPIREWPGTLRPAHARRPSPFRRPGGDLTPLTTTLRELDRELDMIGARKPELLIAVPPEQFKADGRPYVRATAAHPGVVLSAETKAGLMSWPCDTFTTWQANLRAVVLALEALRQVARYGVAGSGEQYRGFLAIESATAAPAMSPGLAYRVLAERSGIPYDDLENTPSLRPTALRRALRATHPDTAPAGVAPTAYRDVLAAEAYLRESGRI